MKRVGQGGAFVRVWLVAAAALATGFVAPSVLAGEGRGDLNVELRLVETVADKGPAGASPVGVARVEVLVEAFAATDGIELSVLRADGSAWASVSGPLRVDDVAWSDPVGRPLQAAATGPTIPSRGAIRTTFAVPLQGARIHEIVIRATGVAHGVPVATEGALRVPFGVPDGLPVDDGTFANFSLQDVR